MDKARALQIFTRVARLASFRRAATELGLTPQAISRSVETLERTMGVRLLLRTTRSVSLTEEGAELLGRAEAALTQLDDVLRAATSPTETVSGVVRIAAPTQIGRDYIAPIAMELKRKYPKLVPELVIQDTVSDIIQERIDVAVRAGRTIDDRLIARRVAAIQHMVCASPGYLARHGAPRHWEDLRHHQLTGFRMISTGKIYPWERQKTSGDVAYDEFELGFIANETSVELRAVLAGIGIGQLAGFSAVPHLRSGRLKLLFPETITEQFGLFVVYPRRDLMPLRTRTVIDFLIERLSAEPDFYLKRSEFDAYAYRPARARRRAAD